MTEDRYTSELARLAERKEKDRRAWKDFHKKYDESLALIGHGLAALGRPEAALLAAMLKADQDSVCKGYDFAAPFIATAYTKNKDYKTVEGQTPVPLKSNYCVYQWLIDHKMPINIEFDMASPDWQQRFVPPHLSTMQFRLEDYIRHAAGCLEDLKKQAVKSDSEAMAALALFLEENPSYRTGGLLGKATEAFCEKLNKTYDRELDEIKVRQEAEKYRALIAPSGCQREHIIPPLYGHWQA